MSRTAADEKITLTSILRPEAFRCESGRGVVVTGGPELVVDVVAANDAWSRDLPDAAKILARAARAAYGRVAAVSQRGPAGAPVTVTFLLSDDRHLRDLNRTFRGHDRATNVLSFPPGDDAVFGPEAGTGDLGDVALAWEMVAREADAYGIALGDHVAHLSVHAILHLLGYDHESADEAEAMESIERDVLADLAIADPYVSERP